MRDTIDMAETISHGWWLDDEKLKAFEALVRADEREKYEGIIVSMTKLLEAQQKRESVSIDMIAAGIAAEREACIKIAERKISKTWAAPKSPKEWWEMACKQIANDIRTRGNT